MGVSIMKKCFKITMDNEDDMLTRPYYWYVIADTMKEACEYTKTVKNKSAFHEIKKCELLGDAP